MNESLWILLLKVFGGPLVSGLVAAGITYWLSRRRFIGERWWDRKADAYGNIVGALATMERYFKSSQEILMAVEKIVRSGEDVPKDMEERTKGMASEFDKARDSIERAVAEGDYVISREVSGALSEFLGRFPDFEKPPSMSELVSWSRILSDATRSCLEVVRAEARSDLQVK